MFRFLPLLLIGLVACKTPDYGDTRPPTDTPPVDTADTDTTDTVSVDTGLFCGVDGYEPNQTLADAVQLAGEGDYPGLVTYKSDEDWWILEVPADTTATVSALFRSRQGNIELQALDSTGDNVANASSRNDNEVVSFQNQGGIAQSFYLRVYLYDEPCNTYDLQVIFADIPPEICDDGIDNDYDEIIDCDDYSCVEDPICNCPPEDPYEPNNYISQATPLASGTDLMVHKADEDVFSFEVPDNSAATVTVAFHNNLGDIDITLYDSTQNSIDSSSGTSNTEQVQVFNESGSTQTYYLAVRLFIGSSSACNSYDFNITIDGVPTCNEDSYEPNDSLATAVSLSAGSGLLVRDNSPDFFNIDVPGYSSVSVNIDWVEVFGSLNLALYDDSQVAVDTDNGYNGNASVSVYNDSTTARTYTAKIALDTAGCNNYTYASTIVTCQEDSYEPNDTQAEAVALTQATGLGVNLGSDDWWAFEVHDGATASVNLSFIDDLGDIDLRVESADGTSIGVSLSSTDNESIVFTNNTGATATYYAGVDLFGSANNCNIYDLDIVITP